MRAASAPAPSAARRSLPRHGTCLTGRVRPQGAFDKDQAGLASPGARSGAATWHPHAQPAANGAPAEPQAWTSRLADVPAKPPALPAANGAPDGGAEPGAGAVPGVPASAAPCAAAAPAKLPALPAANGAPAGSVKPGDGAALEVLESAASPAPAPKRPAPLLANGGLAGGAERSRSPTQKPAASAVSPAAAVGANVPVANGGPAGGSPRSPAGAHELAGEAAARAAAALGVEPGRVELWGAGLQGTQAALAPLGPAKDVGAGAPPASLTWAAAGGDGRAAVVTGAGPPRPALIMRRRVLALV